MLKKLDDLFGIKLSWKRILELAGEAAPGRPHVATAMVEAGHVSSFKEAFNKYLNNDGPCFVHGTQFPPAEAVKVREREIEERERILSYITYHPPHCDPPPPQTSDLL
jgi:predicted metal-dependent phosphoesterase TrpH